MRFNDILIFVVVITLLTACKKDKGPVIEQPTTEPEEQFFYKDLKVDSIKQFSIVVSYQLREGFKTTGVATDQDSIALVDHLAQYMYQEAVFRNNRYYLKIEWPDHFPPANDKIWFRLYVADENGEKTYSKVFGQKVASYQVKNKYIVNGKGGNNKHPKDFYINYEGSPIGAQDNSLIVNAITSDVNIQNYRATLDEKIISIGRIDEVQYYPTQKQILFDVPEDLPAGPSTLKFYYQNKLVYTERLTIVDGGLLTSVPHPLNRTSSGAFFEYGEKLFTFTSFGISSSDVNFYSWTPGNNVWQKLPVPTDMPYLVYNILKGGKAINGTIYFNPVTNGMIGTDDLSYAEYIISYHPASGKWKKTQLYYANDASDGRGMRIYDSFVYEGKLYCITLEETNGSHSYQIRAYDPVNDSWAYFMRLPDLEWGCVAVINNKQVYLLSSQTDRQEGSNLKYLNEFYLLNISGKSIVKKNWITDRRIGVLSPYLTSFNNKIYVYGGSSSNGFQSNYSSLFAVFDPLLNNWSPVSGYSYFTAWASQTEGFMFPIGNKLYLGLGIDRKSNGHIFGSKVSALVHQVMVR